MPEQGHDQVSAALQQVPMPRAMEILEGLEEGAASVPDPTGHVLAMAAEGGGVQEIPPAAEPAAPRSPLRPTTS